MLNIKTIKVYYNDHTHLINALLSVLRCSTSIYGNVNIDES